MTAAGHAPRIAPLEPPYDPDVADAARALDASGQPRSSRWRCSARSHVHEQLASRMRPLGAGILGSRATVPLRLREVMIDRTCALTGAEYEWGVHAGAFGAAAGLDDEQLRSTVQRRLGRRTAGSPRRRRCCASPRSSTRRARSPTSCGRS